MIKHLTKKDTNDENRFTEEQIINILSEAQAGAKAEKLCCRYGISYGTYYLWKNKYVNMNVSEAKLLRALESKNIRLKKIVADQQLVIVALKDGLSKKWHPPQAKRGCYQAMAAIHGHIERRASERENNLYCA